MKKKSSGRINVRPIPEPIFEYGYKNENDPDFVSLDVEETRQRCELLLSSVPEEALLCGSEDQTPSKRRPVLTAWERDFLTDTIEVCLTRPRALTGKHIVLLGKLWRRAVLDTKDCFNDL